MKKTIVYCVVSFFVTELILCGFDYAVIIKSGLYAHKHGVSINTKDGKEAAKISLALKTRDNLVWVFLPLLWVGGYIVFPVFLYKTLSEDHVAKEELKPWTTPDTVKIVAGVLLIGTIFLMQYFIAINRVTPEMFDEKWKMEQWKP